MTVCGYAEKKRKLIVKLFRTRYNQKDITFRQPMFISRLSVNTLTLSLVDMKNKGINFRAPRRPTFTTFTTFGEIWKKCPTFTDF